MTKQRNSDNHNELDREHSWYWNVLVKEYGSWKKAEKAILESRNRVDLLLWGEYE